MCFYRVSSSVAGSSVSIRSSRHPAGTFSCPQEEYARERTTLLVCDSWTRGVNKKKKKKKKKAERDEWKKRNSMAEILSLFASSVREKYKVRARYKTDSLIHDNC